jgi:hypothetical protein
MSPIRHIRRGNDLGIDGRIILKCILNKLDVRIWIGLNWPRIGTIGGFL